MGRKTQKKVDAKIFQILNPKTQKLDLPGIVKASDEGLPARTQISLALGQASHGSLKALDGDNQCLGIERIRPRGLKRRISTRSEQTQEREVDLDDLGARGERETRFGIVNGEKGNRRTVDKLINCRTIN